MLVMYLFVISKAATWGININFTDVTSDFYVPLFKVRICVFKIKISISVDYQLCLLLSLTYSEINFSLTVLAVFS